MESVTSQALIDEWLGVVTRPSVLRYLERKRLIASDYVELVETLVGVSVQVEPLGDAPACRDENDRKYLHCCLAGAVDVLVSTDLDLLEVETLGVTRILRPAEAWDLLLAEP